AVVPQFDVFHVVEDGAQAFGLVHHLVGWNENELRVLVDEFLDQPWAGDPVDLDVLARDPFHAILHWHCIRTPPRAHQYLGRCETAHCRACWMGACGGNAARNFRTVGCASILSRHRQKAGYFGYMPCLPWSVRRHTCSAARKTGPA